MRISRRGVGSLLNLSLSRGFAVQNESLSVFRNLILILECRRISFHRIDAKIKVNMAADVPYGSKFLKFNVSRSQSSMMSALM